MFCRRVELFLKFCLISSVWIITMIGSFYSSSKIAVGLDVFRSLVEYFKPLTRTMMSSGLWNYIRMYCLRLSLNFLYLSLAYICLDVVPKTAPKSSTSPLKCLIDDVYAGRLKLLPRPPRLWWSPILVQPPQPHPRPPLLELDLFVS